MPKYDRELIARMLETPSVFEDASRREQARLLREADNLEADARTVVREVPEGMVLVPREPTEVMCEAAMSSLGWTRSEAAAKTAPITPASPMMEGSMKVWSAMLAAAPAASGVDTSTNEAWAARAQEKIATMEAASGGEDDMCPNCVTPWKCNGPHESTGGASVSERARELVRRWRECAKSAANGPMFDGASEYAVAGTYIDCADKLESLLSAASDHQQNAAQGGKE